VVGHYLLVQLPHPAGEGWLIEKARKVGEPLGTPRHNFPCLLDADASINAWRTDDAFVECSDLNGDESILAVMGNPNLGAKGVIFARIDRLEIAGGIHFPKQDMSVRRPRLEPVFEALRG